MMKIIILILSGFIAISNLNAEEETGHEENFQVGVGKGIVAASEDDGIKLSPQAEKNFEIQKVTGNIIAKSALVKVGEEVNIYRYRDGFYKRIDFQIVKKVGDQIHIKSHDLKPSDQIVVQGMGFIRVAEIAAFGGAVSGHSH
ncbi:MAG: hypothetical protein H7235_01390 [Bdellovibrionaceae bacterium]|nr:hypothetical protein [Pseudobdellovibrionaceae bacterium]